MIIVIIYTSECAPLTASSIFNNFIISSNLIVSTNPAEVYNFVIKNKSWPVVQRFKKHTSLDHYKKCSSALCAALALTLSLGACV